MDKFLEKYNLPKVNEEKAQSLNRPRTDDKIQAVIKKLLAHKSPGLDGFVVEFKKTFKEEVTPYNSQTIPKHPRRGKTPNSFYYISIILIPKPDKDTTKNENYRPISLKNIEIILANCSSNASKKSYTMTM